MWLKTFTIGSCCTTATSAPSVSYSSSASSGTPTTSVNSSVSSSVSFLLERIRSQSEITPSPISVPRASMSLIIATPIVRVATNSTNAPQKPKNPASNPPNHVPAFPPKSAPGKRPANARMEAAIITRPEVVRGSRAGRPNPA